MKIYYENTQLDKSHYDINDFLLFKSPPNWWKKLTPFIHNATSIKQLIEKDGMHSLKNSNSAKLCPSFHSVFKNSVLIKSPAEIFLEVNKFGYDWNASNNLINITHHPNNQAPEYLGEKYHFIKFELPFDYFVDKKCSLVIQNPTLHNKMFYEVCPGQIELLPNQALPINLVCLIDKSTSNEKSIYHIKCGEVLAMLTFSETIQSLTPFEISKSNKKNWAMRKSFIGSWKKDSLQ
jgi:hypothetical protein